MDREGGGHQRNTGSDVALSRGRCVLSIADNPEAVPVGMIGARGRLPHEEERIEHAIAIRRAQCGGPDRKILYYPRNILQIISTGDSRLTMDCGLSQREPNLTY